MAAARQRAISPGRPRCGGTRGLGGRGRRSAGTRAGVDRPSRLFSARDRAAGGYDHSAAADRPRFGSQSAHHLGRGQRGRGRRYWPVYRCQHSGTGVAGGAHLYRSSPAGGVRSGAWGRGGGSGGVRSGADGKWCRTGRVTTGSDALGDGQLGPARGRPAVALRYAPAAEARGRRAAAPAAAGLPRGRPRRPAAAVRPRAGAHSAADEYLRLRGRGATVRVCDGQRRPHPAAVAGARATGGHAPRRSTRNRPVCLAAGP